MVYDPGKPLDFVERVFEHTDWEANSQQHLAEMAHALSKRVSTHSVESATVHIFEKSTGTVTVKMVAGPE